MSPVAAAAVSAARDIDVRHGERAYALLRDPAFRQSWTSLHASCEWATVCQSPAFAEAWFAVYGDQYVPLLIHARDANGELSGLLALATDDASEAIVHVGAQQAEYQVWIAKAEAADAFAEAALDALAERFPGRKLVLQFLPPRVPLGWRSAGKPWSKKTLLVESARPVLTLGPEGHVESSLRKKKNKSRMSALSRSGPVRLVELRTRGELETAIDRIAEQYDFRQRILSDAMPFRDDARKRSFLLSLIERPGLLSAAVLMVGDDVAAANVGLIDRDSVGIGVLAHSPFFAEHSPGKVLVLLLARELAKDGYANLDLTPGGTYKSRFADTRDTAHILEIYFDRLQCAGRTARNRAIDAGKSVLRALRLDPDDVKTRALVVRQSLLAGGMHNAPRNLIAMIARRLGLRQDLIVYAQDRARIGQPARLHALSRDCLADLLTYRQEAPGDPPPMAFLLEAQKRLLLGAHVYTMTERGALAHRAWLAKPHGAITRVSPANVTYPPRSCVMWHDYTHAAAVHIVTHELSMLQRMRDAAYMPDIERIFMEVPAGDALARECAEKLGFEYYGVVVRRMRWPRSSSRWLEAPAHAAGSARRLGRLSSLVAALCALGAASIDG